jgi:hypothetical protein
MDAVAASGSQSNVAPPPPAAIVTAVVINPMAATLVGGSSQQFSAAVLGQNSPSQGGIWSCTFGAIDTSGLFTAPATTPGHQYGKVTFTSDADSSKSASADIAIPGSSPPVQSGIFQSRRRGSRRVQRFS